MRARRFEAAALREATEEIGIDPNAVELLGRLTPLHIPVSGFLLHPIVGFTSMRPAFQRAEWEVARIIEAPVSLLVRSRRRQARNPDARGQGAVDRRGRAVFRHRRRKSLGGDRHGAGGILRYPHLVKALAIALVAAFALTTAVNQRPSDPLVEKFFAAETPADAEAMAAQFEPFDPRLPLQAPSSRAARISTKSAASTRCDGNRSRVRTSTTSSTCRPITIRRRSGSCACSCTAASAVRRRTRRRRAAQPTPTGRTPNRIEGEKQIYLHPSGWVAAQWWDEEQIDNILRAVDTLKRKYNIDETKIYVTGISDGGTGVYYMALKEPNPWSSYLPLNGSLAVLRNPDNGADGEMHGNNLVNAPLVRRQRRERSAVSGGAGRAAHRVAEADGRQRRRSARRPAPQHNTAWWPTERAPFEQFVHDHPRAAHPDALSWETERVDRFNRNRWLIINELRADASRATELTDLGFFRHTKRSGRVDIRRKGNTFDAIVRDVAVVHAAAVAGCDRFRQAGRRDGERQAGVQRHREEGSGHVDALGRARQRSHRALRRRAEDRRP